MDVQLRLLASYFPSAQSANSLSQPYWVVNSFFHLQTSTNLQFVSSYVLQQTAFIYDRLYHFPTSFTTKYRAQQPPRPHFLSFQQFFYFVFLPFQVILLLIQTIPLFAEFFHALKLRPYFLPAIRLYLFIFPGQIADCIVVFLYLFRQAYPVYQILHFLVRFVKVCNRSTIDCTCSLPKWRSKRPKSDAFSCNRSMVSLCWLLRVIWRSAF